MSQWSLETRVVAENLNLNRYSDSLRGLPPPWVLRLAATGGNKLPRLTLRTARLRWVENRQSGGGCGTVFHSRFSRKNSEAPRAETNN
jgi:hypothetical protein